jgi:tripartite-type tricarboxylate transporter receptor subunit TctC
VGVYDSARAIFTDERHSSFGEEQKQNGRFGDCAAYHRNYFWDGFSQRWAVETIKFVVGYSPGGLFDSLTRLVARHFSKHVPGNPNVIVDNMTGAGGIVLGNHLYHVAKPDGLTGA